LNKEKEVLLRKIRDRDEEIQGKAQMVQDVQDEMLALQLQLNMAEQREEKVRKENDVLVKRWMERMGKEADEMNLRSNWK
jgi:hypothetical protein